MAKSTGLGDRLLVGGYNLSGDIGALDSITAMREEIEQTGIDKSAKERIYGQRDGALEFTSFFNKAAGQSHPILSALPRTDRVITYLRGTTQGNAGAAMVAKQIGYDGERDDKGTFTFKTEAKANAYGLDWGRQLTAGVETCATLLTSPTSDFEGGIGTWTSSNANATVAASAAQARTGTGSLGITGAGSGDSDARHAGTQVLAVSPGDILTVQGWFRAAATTRSVRIGFSWRTAAGALVSTAFPSNVTDSSSAWTLSTHTAVAPATAAFVQISAVVIAIGAAEVHYLDDVSVVRMPAGLSSLSGTSSTFGLQAYLQVTAFTGTNATIKLQESSDNAAADAYADVTGGAFTAVTAVGAERIATSATQTIERYLRPVVTTTGGFSVLNYNLVVVRNETAPVI